MTKKKQADFEPGDKRATLAELGVSLAALPNASDRLRWLAAGLGEAARRDDLSVDAALDLRQIPRTPLTIDKSVWGRKVLIEILRGTKWDEMPAAIGDSRDESTMRNSWNQIASQVIEEFAAEKLAGRIS